jgi:hypothetical protein
VLLAALLTLPPAQAAGVPTQELENMDLVGEARMRVLFWDVYDAQLFAPAGKFSPDRPFALALTYLRELQGERIAERSIQEIRDQGFGDESTLRRWEQALTAIFPDVDAQDELVGVADDDGHTRFYLDGELIGAIEEPAFTRAFFAIWLSEATSAPRLREQLLGLNR